MQILMSYLSVTALVLAMATPALAHLMLPRTGTVNIVNNNAFRVLPMPLSAFDDFDDNGDGEISVAEFNRYRSGVIQVLSQHVILRDQGRQQPQGNQMHLSERPGATAIITLPMSPQRTD